MTGHLSPGPIPPLRLTSESNFLEEIWGPVVGAAVTELEARERLDRGKVIGIDLQRGVVGRQRFVDAAGALERERKIHPGVGMAGHELSRPLKLVCRFVELSASEMDDAEVIVCRSVMKISRQRVAQQTFGSFRIGVDELGGFLRELLSLEWIARGGAWRLVWPGHRMRTSGDDEHKGKQ